MTGPDVLDRVYAVIRERKLLRPAGSYVVQLLDGGIGAIGAKLREEGDELIEAARGGDAAQIAHEAADLIFHAWVLLGAVDLAADHQLPIWDAVIVAAAADARCRLLLSEDLQEGFTWGGVTVANPFSPSRHPLLQSLTHEE